MKSTVFSSLVITLLVLVTAPAMAQVGKIQAGNLKIIPGITVLGVHDDNIYLGSGTNNTTEVEESDWITHLMPSLFFDYSFAQRGSLNFGYRGDFAYYDDNDQNDWKRHEGIFCLNYNSPGGLIFGIDNLYVDTEDPYSSENEYGLGMPQVERWHDRLKTKIGYDFSDQFKLLAYYNFYKQDYDDDIDFSQDFKYYELGVGAQIKLRPKTWGFVRYHYGERDYYTHPATTGVNDSNDSDYDWHRVNLGLTWDAAAKLGGELNLGYQWKDYSNPTDVYGDAYDEKNTWIARTLISFDATPNSTLGLGLTRALRETGSFTNEYFEDTGISINLQQAIIEKVSLRVDGVYSTHDYNVPTSKEREDDNYEAKIGLDYQIQDWLSASVGYEYWKKDSNYREFEFTDNRFLVSFRSFL